MPAPCGSSPRRSPVVPTPVVPKASFRAVRVRPDLEVHAFVNDVSRSTGAMVCGRRLHETMRYWDTAPTDADSSDAAASVTSASAGPPSRRRR